MPIVPVYKMRLNRLVLLTIQEIKILIALAVNGGGLRYDPKKDVDDFNEALDEKEKMPFGRQVWLNHLHVRGLIAPQHMDEMVESFIITSKGRLVLGHLDTIQDLLQWSDS